MRNPLLTVWLIVTFSAAGFGDIVYLSRQRNSSVEFSCTSTNVNAKPFAFSLMRDLVKPEKVLYEYFGKSPSIFNEKDKNRFVVRVVDSSHHQVTVNISHLLGRHTDLYHCVFHYDFQKFEDYPGKPKFFLYVEDSIPEECTCYSYEPLLYALSAAAVLLFLCVLILAGAYCKRPPSQPKPQTVPIYEEMNGVRTVNGKAGSCHFSTYLNEQEETETSEYIRPRRENPYDPLPGSDPYSL
ncbi:uncharacterized protein LOC108424824 isoform X1 [Pygocentrus nattereri]|uniref:Uncharacterized protein n=1 Tax=Pygocentrus nattereri TaxID=42514 RepID=A0A3B4D9U8_PYGNA|nr:uncharacterized protein LOC108424824 isoform X1 [Pygocentrus nattereri]